MVLVGYLSKDDAVDNREILLLLFAALRHLSGLRLVHLKNNFCHTPKLMNGDSPVFLIMERSARRSVPNYKSHQRSAVCCHRKDLSKYFHFSWRSQDGLVGSCTCRCRWHGCAGPQGSALCVGGVLSPEGGVSTKHYVVAWWYHMMVVTWRSALTRTKCTCSWNVSCIKGWENSQLYQHLKLSNSNNHVKKIWKLPNHKNRHDQRMMHPTNSQL